MYIKGATKIVCSKLVADGPAHARLTWGFSCRTLAGVAG
jgi:hypothetical protein